MRRRHRHSLGTINAKLDRLITEVANLHAEVAGLGGRVAHLPTTVRLITLVFVILAGAFAVLRFGLPAAGP